MSTRLVSRLFWFVLFFICIGRATEAAGAVTPEELHTKSGGLVWVYLPPEAPPGEKLGCVLVPPAGTRLFHGMTLGEGDRAEHLPYVAAGFAVVSFDISGPLTDDRAASLRKALVEFKGADFGVKDGLEALRLVLDKFPQIDARRVYVAGHSSAGTLALQIAQSSDQVGACIAYAPIVDLEQRLGADTLARLDRASPGFSKLLLEVSPSARVSEFKCPVFLFHADDDGNVPTEEVLALRRELVIRQMPVKYVSVSSGGHYDSMIETGMPRAIAWLKAIDQERRK